MTSSRGTWAVAAVILLMVPGCGTTRQARSVPKSGFLGDYSKLEPGPEGGALLVYQNPAANVKAYDKIQLEPISLWMANDSQMNDLSKEDRKRVADRLFQLLQTRLAKDYKLVTTAGPGTMKIEAALTSAESSAPVRDTLSSIVPLALAISSLKSVATGKPSFVGEATAELKVTDASTGVVLYEAVDRRLGTKNPAGLFNKWEDVDDALEYWANRVGYRLCTDRGASACVAP